MKHPAARSLPPIRIAIQLLALFGFLTAGAASAQQVPARSLADKASSTHQQQQASIPNPPPQLWQGIPALERTPKGRIFVAWFTGGFREPSPENTVLLSRSDDGGVTFLKPEALARPQEGKRCFDAALWIDPLGRLWLLFNRGTRDAGIGDVRARICEDPDAATPVFGPEFRIGFDGVGSAFRLNKPTVLTTGEWLMPVTYSKEVLHPWSRDQMIPSKEPTLQGVAISRDAGKSWTLHGGVIAPPFALEGMVTELKDGRLWLLNRSNPVGFLWESYSTDHGQTWSEGKATSIPSPGARFFIRRLSSGNLLLVNHYRYSGRSHLTARLSRDDGKTWNDGLLLDERNGVSYPDGVQDQNGLIWIVYDRDRYGAGEVLLAKFREEDVIAGRNASGAVTLRQVVNQLDKSPQWLALEAADAARIKAMQTASKSSLEEILSDELHYGHSTGAVDTKNSLIDTLVSGRTKYRAFYYEQRNFTFPAEGIALMTGRVRVKAEAGGDMIDNMLSFLAVWRLEGGRWRFLSWQSCKLPKE